MNQNNITTPAIIKNVGDASAVRKRVKYEDNLLLSRSNLILVLNGLVAIASGIQFSDDVIIPMIAAIIIADILWLHFGHQANKYIDYLINQLRDANKRGIKIPIDEKMRFEQQESMKRIGPTYILTILIPIATLTGWAVVLFILIVRH